MGVYIWGLIVAMALATMSYLVLKEFVKPVSSEKKKLLENSKKAGRNLDEFNLKQLRDELLQKIKGIYNVSLSDLDREEMAKDLNRLGIEKTPEDIRRLQILYALIFLILAIFMFFISPLLGIIMLASTLIIWKIPTNSIKKEINLRNAEFLLRLDELYSIIFNQYKRKNDEHLGNIIAAYIPTTSELMRKELMLVMRDIESGEDYALKQLKQRIPRPLILRFCDIILNNLEGVDNVDVMDNFYQELKQIRDRERRKRNEKRASKIDMVNKTLYAPFIFLVIIYLAVSTISNF